MVAVDLGVVVVVVTGGDVWAFAAPFRPFASSVNKR